MRNIKIYLIELLLFIFIIVFNTVFKNNFVLYGLIVALTIASYLLFGFYKDNSYIKSNVTRVVISCLLSFFIISYATGLFVGFNKTVLSISSDFIFKVIILELVVIICEELMRYIISRNSYKSKIPIILYTIILCILNIIIEINGYNFADREMLFIFASVVIVVVISREALCSYITYKVSWIPSLVFKSVIVLYEFILPIIPKLGNYLFSVFNLILVFCIFIFSNRIITYSDKSNLYSKKMSRRVIYIPILAVLLVVVALVSGIFKYKMIAIGSNSMMPVYEKGDAVIYEKMTADKIGIGDIIAFKKSGVIITHRVVEIHKDINYVFKTKGDYNNTVDGFDVDASDILGKVEYKISYIGYPTIWINDFFQGRRDQE